LNGFEDVPLHRLQAISRAPGLGFLASRLTIVSPSRVGAINITSTPIPTTPKVQLFPGQKWSPSMVQQESQMLRGFLLFFQNLRIAIGPIPLA
jgi:hypothetical protein